MAAAHHETPNLNRSVLGSQLVSTRTLADPERAYVGHNSITQLNRLTQSLNPISTL